MSADDILVFGGSGSPHLTRKICDYLQVPPGPGEVLALLRGQPLRAHPGERPRAATSTWCRGTDFPVNDNFMELLFWIDAFSRASADAVTAVMPFFSYAKGDKKDEPRVSIRARVCADAIEAAGADRVVTMDLHAPQIQGFFQIPVDHLYAMPVLGDAFRRSRCPTWSWSSPDAGFAKQARRYAAATWARPLAIGNKQRVGHDEQAEVLDIIGDVAGKTALIVDDFTISGGTLIEMAVKLLERGATAVYAAITHGVFAPGSQERIAASPIERC